MVCVCVWFLKQSESPFKYILSSLKESILKI
jgi:hypothetical protein